MCTCSMHCCCPPVSGMLQALADRTDTVLDGLVAETDQVSGALADAADTSLGIVADATETYLAVPPTLANLISIPGGQDARPMIQNGPPEPARRLASFRMMDRSHAF